MKHFSLYALCILLHANLFANEPYRILFHSDWIRIDTLDTAFMRIEYEMSFPSSLNADSTYVDRRIVEIGNTFRKDYSYALNSAELNKRRYDDLGVNSPFGMDEPAYPLELFQSPSAIQMRYETMSYGPILHWEDELFDETWELKEDVCNILGYDCKKAVTTFKGREYIAWYSSDIPVDAGPYKFRGLPGLILKIENSDYSWEAKGIEQGEWPIYIKQFNAVETTRQNAQKFIMMMFNAPYDWETRALGRKVQKADLRTHALRELTEEEKQYEYIYNPIEID